MSEMKIGILLLSALVIALVFGFNFYQEWRFRKKTSQAFARHHADVLLDVPKNNVRDGKQERLEPVLLDDEEDSTPAYLNDVPPPPLVRQPEPAPEPVVAEMPELDAADHQALVVSLRQELPACTLAMHRAESARSITSAASADQTKWLSSPIERSGKGCASQNSRR